jgi:hypothetical protein
LYAFFISTKCPTNLILCPLVYHNNIWRILKILCSSLSNFSPTSWNFFPLKSKYFPQHSLLTLYQAIFFP